MKTSVTCECTNEQSRLDPGLEEKTILGTKKETVSMY